MSCFWCYSIEYEWSTFVSCFVHRDVEIEGASWIFPPPPLGWEGGFLDFLTPHLDGGAPAKDEELPKDVGGKKDPPATAPGPGRSPDGRP